eukprot:767300-Hanusia_phi.AAC.1
MVRSETAAPRPSDPKPPSSPPPGPPPLIGSSADPGLSARAAAWPGAHAAKPIAVGPYPRGQSRAPY